MEQAWQLERTSDYRRFKYEIGDYPAAHIPRVDCPSCGELRTWGLDYPCADLQQLDDEVFRQIERNDQTGIGPISLDAYRALEQVLAPLLGPDRPLRPSTGLGPSSGLAEGAFPDICWAGRSVGKVFMPRSSFDTARKAGFALNGVEPEIRYRRKRKDPLIELEILPSLHVHPSLRPKYCSTCGFANERPEPMRLSREDFDDSIPLQRVYERPEVIVANAAFAAFIRTREFADVKMTPMIFE